MSKMSKKISKSDFVLIIDKAISAEASEYQAATGGSPMAVTLLGASICGKIMRLMFDNEDELEIITDKE